MGDMINWGFFKRHFWGALLRYQHGRRLGKLLYAGNLQKARMIFGQACKDGRFTMLTIRHGKRVVDGWPRK
jgi:hypothetical protein